MKSAIRWLANFIIELVLWMVGWWLAGSMKLENGFYSVSIRE